jgi:hypothetical protein
MSVMVKQRKKTGFEEGHMAPGVRLGNDNLAPEVKTANEIVCHHVWDKVYPPFL